MLDAKKRGSNLTNRSLWEEQYKDSEGGSCITGHARGKRRVRGILVSFRIRIFLR